MNSLNCWFRGDIANALDALESSMRDGASMVPRRFSPAVSDYTRGYFDACRAVRIMFGIACGIPARDTAAAEPPANRLIEGGGA